MIGISLPSQIEAKKAVPTPREQFHDRIVLDQFDAEHHPADWLYRADRPQYTLRYVSELRAGRVPAPHFCSGVAVARLTNSEMINEGAVKKATYRVLEVSSTNLLISARAVSGTSHPEGRPSWTINRVSNLFWDPTSVRFQSSTIGLAFFLVDFTGLCLRSSLAALLVRWGPEGDATGIGGIVPGVVTPTKTDEPVVLIKRRIHSLESDRAEVR